MKAAIRLVSAAAPAPATSVRQLPHHEIGVKHFVLVSLPLLAVAAGAASMWKFVSFAMMSNPVLNGIIVAVLSWGAWTMIDHVRGVARENAAFARGMRWLRGGAASGEQDPRLGPYAFVSGMLDRLQKLGLGHQVYIHSSAMEPEVDALEQYLVKRQELSQFLVGLMVGLGLLGTFVGLLETLVETSALIGTIAHSAGGGGDMEGEFTKIVGGLQKPLTAMGTAFSASMFGLVGSIVLGFQLVAVRKAASDFVETVRGEVLSLAEKSNVSEKVEISERFLAALLADILEQHRASGAGLAEVGRQVATLVAQVTHMSQASGAVVEQMKSQEAMLGRAASAVGGASDVLPGMARLVAVTEGLLERNVATQAQVTRVSDFLPSQQALGEDVRAMLGRLASLEAKMDSLSGVEARLTGEVHAQADILKRMDATLWNAEKDAVRVALARLSEPSAS